MEMWSQQRLSRPNKFGFMLYECSIIILDQLTLNWSTTVSRGHFRKSLAVNVAEIQMIQTNRARSSMPHCRQCNRKLKIQALPDGKCVNEIRKAK